MTYQAEKVHIKVLGLAQLAVLELILLIRATDHTPPDMPFPAISRHC